MAAQRQRTDRAKRLRLLVLLALSLGCRAESHGSVQIVLGKSPGERPLEMNLKTAFAEYVVLPELRSELRITLANYPLSCADPALPREGDLALVVTVVTPPDQPPAPGAYDWGGRSSSPGGVDRAERAYAMPLVRQGSRAYEFRPGGGMELRELGLSQGAPISGLLSFEFTGDAERPAQSIKGSFNGHVCRAVPASAERDD